MDKRISWGYLCVEITRRCNLKCAHCLRGDAQDIDISDDVMVALLDKTKSINKILFTGGEPFLNVAGMMRFLDLLKERDIPLYYVDIITNGTQQNDNVIKLAKEYSEYVDYCHDSKPLKYRDMINLMPINISISVGKYHETLTDSESHYNWYLDNLSEYANINRNTTEMLVAKLGRAKELEDSEYIMDLSAYYIPSKICYFTSKKDFPCDYSHIVVPDHDEVVIPCKIDVSVIGDVTEGGRNLEWTDTRKITTIFESTESILSAIDHYNEDKPYCKFLDKQPYNQDILNEFAKYLLWGYKKYGRDFIIASVAKTIPDYSEAKKAINDRLQLHLPPEESSPVSDEEVERYRPIDAYSNFSLLSNDIVYNEQLRRATEFEKYVQHIMRSKVIPEKTKTILIDKLKSVDNAKQANDPRYFTLKRNAETSLKLFGLVPLRPIDS